MRSPLFIVNQQVDNFFENVDVPIVQNFNEYISIIKSQVMIKTVLKNGFTKI